MASAKRVGAMGEAVEDMWSREIWEIPGRMGGPYLA